jgi:hypothetical protein
VNNYQISKIVKLLMGKYDAGLISLEELVQGLTTARTIEANAKKVDEYRKANYDHMMTLFKEQRFTSVEMDGLFDEGDFK